MFPKKCKNMKYYPNKLKMMERKHISYSVVCEVRNCEKMSKKLRFQGQFCNWHFFRSEYRIKFFFILNQIHPYCITVCLRRDCLILMKIFQTRIWENFILFKKKLLLKNRKYFSIWNCILSSVLRVQINTILTKQGLKWNANSIGMACGESA